MSNENFYTEEHNIFRQSLQKFCKKELLPYVEEWEERKEIPREIWHKLAGNGYLGIWVDEKYGGANCDIRYLTVLWEELAKVSLGLCADISMHSDMILLYIYKFGTEEQKKEWIPKCISGDVILSIGMTEPGGGSDLAALKTKAVLDGDEWVINGAKTFITNGFLTDLCVIAARTDPHATAAHKGISLFLVPSSTKGFIKAKKLKKTGLQSSATCELSFDDMRIPKENILGELNKGFYYLMKNLQKERLFGVAVALAISEHMLDLTSNYVKERKVFNKPIGSYQTNAFKIVEMLTEIEICKCYYHTMTMDYLAGIDISNKVTMAKWYTSELVQRVAYNCTQMHGGYGFMSEYAIARFATDVRCLTWVAGTTETMKEIMVRQLGLYEK